MSKFSSFYRFGPVVTAGCAAFRLTLATERAIAGPIQYTATVYGSGTLGSSSFSDALVIFTVEGDTTHIYFQGNDPPYPTLSDATTSIEVSGVGKAVATDSLLVFEDLDFPFFTIDLNPWKKAAGLAV